MKLPMMVYAAISAVAPALWSQPQPATAPPQFAVASLKPNNGCENTPRSVNLAPSPGRLEMPCITLQGLIQTAYGTFADGVSVNRQILRTEGLPNWARSEFYSFAAKGDGPVRTEMLAGPMLQAFLEERFQLKTHRDTREMPVYALTVAKGGIKPPRLPEGGCTPIDLTHPPAPRAPGEPPPNLCGLLMTGPTSNGGMMMELRGSTTKQFAQSLSGRLDRPVIDETGVAGLYTFHLEFAIDPGMPGFQVPRHKPGAAGSANPTLPDPTLPTIFAALQEQLGLKLAPEKGPVQYLVVDHVEKPAAN
jgi:uncharacterized protein (TIGR03435 family)